MQQCHTIHNYQLMTIEYRISRLTWIFYGKNLPSKDGITKKGNDLHFSCYFLQHSVICCRILTIFCIFYLAIWCTICDQSHELFIKKLKSRQTRLDEHGL